ncbi:MAG: hypothetical protein Q8R08_00545 [bacterium]|nr:hypothetical protein [bacterium]
MANGTRTKAVTREYPLITGKERLLIWKKVIGMWKDRKPDPIKELQKMRREGERKLPSLKNK